MNDPSVLSVLRDWLSVISLFGVIATAAALNWLRGHFVSKPDFSEARATAKSDLMEGKAEHLKACLKIEVLEDRLAKVEGELKHLPDKVGMHRMELTMSDMQGDMKVIIERMNSIAATGDRLQEFLVDQARQAVKPR